MFEYDEEKIKKYGKENEKLIEGFETYLEEKKLAPKTIKKHVRNASFYINDYVLEHHSASAAEAIAPVYLDDFFDWFFIRKCMWSSPATIKENASSIRKFYTFMYEKGHVEKQAYEDMKFHLKESVPEYCEDCQIYNDGGEYIEI